MSKSSLPVDWKPLALACFDSQDKTSGFSSPYNFVSSYLRLLVQILWELIDRCELIDMNRPHDVIPFDLNDYIFYTLGNFLSLLIFELSRLLVLGFPIMTEIGK